MHQDEIYRFIVCCVDQKSDAEDVLQSVALKAYLAWDTLRNKNAVKAWLLAITRNTLKDYYAQKAMRVVIDPYVVDQILGSYEETLDSQIVLQDFFKNLPQEWAKVLYLNIYYGLSARQIADTFGINHSAVSKRIYRMKKLLRTALVQGGEEPWIKA